MLEYARSWRDFERTMKNLYIRRNVFRATQSRAEDVRINSLIGDIVRWCTSNSNGHVVVTEEVKEKVLRCIQQLFATSRQREQMRRGWEGPAFFSRFAKWNPTYFYL